MVTDAPGSTAKWSTLGGNVELDEDKTHRIEAIVDLFVVEPGIEKQIVTALEHGLKLGDGLLIFEVVSRLSKAKKAKFYKGFGCKKDVLIAGTMHHRNFTFNDPSGACETCAGIGTTMRVHPQLLVPDTTRSLNGGAFVKEAMNCDKNTWGGRMLYSLSQHYKFDLDKPYGKLSKKVIDLLALRNKGQKVYDQAPSWLSATTQKRRKKDKFSRNHQSNRTYVSLVQKTGKQ